jgi:HAE1 family hydrophobic/amphiphilic exporter-1
LNFSEIFIKRPIATSLLMAGIALFGVVAYRALPVSDLPTVDFPTISVTANLPGADPSTMASSVATPLERQFTTIAGLDSMTSVSQTGTTSITLQFDLDRKIDGASVDVQTAISEATPLLPPGLSSPPSFRKTNPADMPIMFFGIMSQTMALWDLDEYAETMIAQRLSMVSGVAQVGVMGPQKYAVHVQADPRKMASLQIGYDQLAQAIASWNINLPTGTLYGPHSSYNVQANGQLMKAADYQSMVVAWKNGSPVRLNQIAHVVDSVEDDKNRSWLVYPEGAKKAINLMIMRQPGSNTIAVTDNIKKLLPSFQALLPPSVEMTVRGDRSKNIREAFGDIKITMLLTLTLVIGVIFVFLRNVSATFIPSMALPFSIIGTFAVMYVLNYSLDNLSTMALILAVGFVVDDAIVMLENIVRHVEKGLTPMQAALQGSKEISFTIISMTVSLAAVFIPLLFMSGILGRLFREFAVTICAAILISGFVSVTLTPMLCSRILRGARKKSTGIFHRAMDGFFTGLHRGYDWSLRLVLRFRPVMAGVFVVVLASTIYLYAKIPKGFMPDTDNDSISVTTEAAQGTSFYEMVRLQQRINDAIRNDPNVDTFMSSVGAGMGGSGGSNGRMYLNLKPRRQRALNVTQVIEKLRPKLAGFPGMRVFMTVPPTIRMGGRGSKSSYEFTIQGPDTGLLYSEADKLQLQIAKLSMIQDVTSDAQLKNPRVKLVIDRDKAAALQVNAQQIESALYEGFGPSWVSTIYAPTNQYKVLLELDPKYQSHADSLSEVYLKSGTGQLVPLSALVKRNEDSGPLSINHSGQLPSVTISFNLKPGVALGDAVNEIGDLAAKVLPGNFTTSFTGTAKAFQSSLKNMGLLLLIAIAVVYIVLGVLYESYIHPLTILSGLPSAGLGALLTLMIFGIDLNIYSFVGLIMLIGIVMKNAIMQIDFALAAERNEGKSPEDAIHEGCLTRFRPIMMTTMAAMLGALPMALGYGSGGEARRPLGVAVVGGLIFSQLITLYLTPVVYTYMASLQQRRKRDTARIGAEAPDMAVARS